MLVGTTLNSALDVVGLVVLTIFIDGQPEDFDRVIFEGAVQGESDREHTRRETHANILIFSGKRVREVVLSEAISDSRKIKEQEVRDRRRAVSSAILG
jgi:hypothetical protein